MRPAPLFLIAAALASGCADTDAPAPEAGKAAAAPAPPASPAAIPTAAKLPRVVYYVISEA